MASALVQCTNCQTAIPPQLLGLDDFVPCPSCQSLVQAHIFPAIRRAAVVAIPHAALVEGESSCFYHPAKKAVMVCDSCGRFLCALCDLELNGQHLCPSCLESGQQKSKFKNLENSRVLYDRLAFVVATVPLLLLWFSILGAPIALYICARYRKAPCSIVGKSRIRFVMAAIIASLEILGWTVLIIYLVNKR